MANPVIIDAVRSPYGKRNGELSEIHAVELLGQVQRSLLQRHEIDPASVDSVIGGCVTQAGEQSNNVTRFAWLHQGYPSHVPATTIDAQCASGQQASHLTANQIAAGQARIGLATGVESMSRVPLLSNLADGQFGKPRPENWQVDLPAQYEGADRIAEHRGFSRADLDEFGARSQQRAAHAWNENKFAHQIVPISVGNGQQVTHDGGLRETTPNSLANLKPIREGGYHTAGTASQISDGATAALFMDEGYARAEGFTPRGRILAQCLIGGEPQYLLDGPVQAAQELLDRTGLAISDIDVFEVNEAFAAVPMSVAKVHGIPAERLNINGGAIALGHPVGSTGIRLIANVLDELEYQDSQFGMILTCAGGAMAVGTLIERVN